MRQTQNLLTAASRKSWLASALEIQNGRFTAYYADQGPQVLRTPEGGEGVPAHSPGEEVKK